MSAVIKLEVMHVSRENATFAPMKPKVVFRVFKSMEGETSGETNLFLLFGSIKTVYVLFNTVFTLKLDIIIDPLFTDPSAAPRETSPVSGS